MSELGNRFPAVLAAAAAGDTGAFAELWRATHPVLLRYLRVLGADVAEDVASETWMKALRSLSSFSGDEQAFRAWLTVVGRNTFRDQIRAAARRPEALAAEPPAPREVTPDAADAAIERLGTESAMRLLATLPPAQAEMVALRVVVGLEPTEVARIVGRTPGAVRVAVHRALATLAARLAPTGDDAVPATTDGPSIGRAAAPAVGQALGPAVGNGAAANGHDRGPTSVADVTAAAKKALTGHDG